ncbi:DEAD-domain-containing protein [Punctularia strigosozonata HHB-11173 SS5]|uniref:DEAD-domain-containing protein n=1 Tax=Punctularia strigosozonata (strain HHB-11173) TaxID=741275 RepID=UPI0004418043|nr:DEAD-domain-containing protein [Punctularia strigosozonata HHB-11173 SS5]EIN13333.1 DEAD-domain-containing protein [Punctularia strigosozonata HHB-11173 SS5]
MDNVASPSAVPEKSSSGEIPPKKEKKKKEKKSKKSEANDGPTPSTSTLPAPDDDQPPTSAEKKPKKDKKLKKDASIPSAAPTVSSVPSEAEIAAFRTKHAVTVHGSVTPVLSFDQCAIPDDLRTALDGFKEPTPIQAYAWPPALEGRDVVGIAETGSGKTLAFGLPALSRLVTSPPPPPAPSKKSQSMAPPATVTVLVLAPTRELAIQTHDTLTALGAPFGIASVALVGGLDKGPQIKLLRSANKGGKTTRIVVGTPGRIKDLVQEGACDLSQVNYLVLDEADRMLDKGFENDIREIIGYAKQGTNRQTLMFSATWPESVRRLAATFQRDPVRITVGSDDLTANSRVEQVVEVFDDARSKDGRLLDTLRQLKHPKKSTSADARVLVFALYKKEAARVESFLRSKGYAVGALHGDMSQQARMDALARFKDGEHGVLVATDVAARGLDIPNVNAVVNYTFPLTIEDYIHRIGRTGRGGKTGKSITYFTGDGHERALAGELARVLRESGFEAPGLNKFPMTIKKKSHSVYGDFFRDDIPAPSAPTKITF